MVECEATLGITPDQRRELDALASRVNFQLVARRRSIEVRDMTPTVTLANDDNGYEARYPKEMEGKK